MRYSLTFTLLLLACGSIAALAAGTSSGTRSVRPIALRPLRGVRRVLFLGDSITYAGGYVEAIDAFLRLHAPEPPVELINIGLPSETVSGLTEPGHAGGAFPRPDLHERLERALTQTKPNLVAACYGMNDGIYAPFDPERFRKYQEGILRLRRQVQRAGARLWLLTPPPFDPHPLHGQTLPAGRAEYPSGQPFEGYDGVLERYSAWLLEQRAAGWNVIDIHGPIRAYLAERRRKELDFALAGDGVHLNATGHLLIAREILRAWGAPAESLPDVETSTGPNDAPKELTTLIHERQRRLTDAWLTAVGHRRPGMPAGLPLAEATPQADALDARIRELARTMPIPFPGTRSEYHGFARYDFVVDGCAACVVTPHAVAPHAPWIWRAEFFDHRPELDLALLARGFHLVFLEVGNTFGAPSAMKHWDAFYAELTRTYGLSTKPVMEGLSRGGLYIYNWAEANPTRVSVLYGDNPVCDFKSWPGGKGVGPGSPDDWRKLQHDYGFASEAEALAYRKNPIDNLAPLARAKVPIIHVSADADEVVPYPENTVLLQQRYERLGGSIRVIVKHGFKHHPHGLDDPTPLVDFILAHMP
jgi:lysophospholipase L1-like esterase